MKITDMKVNHVRTPMGYACEYPVFSWITRGCRGKYQTGVRMRIGLDGALSREVYDSQWQQEIKSTGFCPNVQLSPRTRYYWQVQVKTERGERIKSPVAWFETGKMEEDWKGKWITAPFSMKDPSVHPLLQKNFQVPADLASARIYACGLGMFELYVNGKKVSEEYLAPFYTDYHEWIQYVTYDLTPLLEKGKENALGVLLGNGWYKGRFSYEPGMKELYGDRFQFLGEIRMETEEGKEVLVASDTSWECAPSPVLESGIYDGEVYDGRKRIPGFSLPGTILGCRAELTEAPRGQVRDRLSPPLVITERKKPVKLIHTPAGECVLDFGQNMTGWVEFCCREKAGSKVRLQYGEVLQEGNFYRENLRTAKAEMVYIADGQERRVRPHFAFYGFRYVKVTGMEQVIPEDFTACVLHSDLKRCGSVYTSNEKLNRLFKNTIWGQRGNFLDVPTDCPQRDERLGWTGDAQAFCGTASFHMETAAFYKKYLYDMRLAQRYYQGGVPHVVPDVLAQVQRKKNGGEDIRTQKGEWPTFGSCGWGDAAAVIPWTLYTFYGDEMLLAEQYPLMRDWVEYIRRIDREQCQDSHLWSAGFHFGDWLALDNPDKTSCFGGTDNTYVATAFYYWSVRLTAKAALVLGVREDAQEYRKLAGEIKKAFQKKYFDREGNLRIQTQTAMVLALYFSLAPAKSRKKVKEELRKNIREHGNHLTTGFVGTCYLCPVLSACGMNKEAYDLLLQEEYPGWLYEVNMGATTVWERWNSILPDGSISDTGMNSLNHYAYGVIAEWFYQYMCGLRPAQTRAGWKAAILAPMPDRRLEYAQCMYESASGTYESSWNWEKDGIVFSIRIPFDARARFVLPFTGKKVTVNGKRCRQLEEEGRKVFPAGTYEICVKK